MIGLALTTLLSPGVVQAGPHQPVSFDEAVRCAGLTQAASELEGGGSGEGRSLYDAALYWSLTAMRLAEASTRPPATAEADQTRARLRAMRELGTADATAPAALGRCRILAPILG